MSLISLSPIYPELVLAIGAMVLLMYGAFKSESEANAETVCWLSVVLLVAAAGLLLMQPEKSQSLFDDAFIVDRYARFMKLLVLGGSATALVLAIDYFKDLKLLKFEYSVLVLLATVGMMMMVSANDLIALYIGLELQSLALYVLAAIRRDSLRSSEAGLKYFVLGALSSGLLLYGSSLVYGFTGTVSFPQIASIVEQSGAGGNIGLTVGLVFVMAGLAFKISAVPFHMWTPDVYEGAPTPVTAFFAAAPKMAAMALLIRVIGGAFQGLELQWQQIIIFMSIASMLLGAFAAIGQTNIKRLMAYSSIGHIGFALVGLAPGSPEGAQGVLVYLTIYLVMTLGTFACILSMRRADGPVEDISELGGLAQTNLPMAFVLAMFMFSLAGIPPLAGFLAKFYVFAAAIKGGPENGSLYILAIIGVLASVVGAYYYLRIVRIMFVDEPKEKFLAVTTKQGVVMTLAGIFVVGAIFRSAPLVDAAAAAAKSLRF